MKVFISHSSRDKWVARRISQDLINLGIETFLDEKDIETGASIDDSVSANLKDCDECLLLLSPAALTSHWVLIEIGGAKALEKRLIPILLHVGANELPSPISKHLARDINEIEKYYQEVKQRLSGRVAMKDRAPKRRRPVKQLIDTFKVGQRIQITTSTKARKLRKEIEWIDVMDEYAGMKATITAVDQDRSARLDVDEGKYWWAFEWLIKER